jgi:hypothetical protein
MIRRQPHTVDEHTAAKSEKWIRWGAHVCRWRRRIDPQNPAAAPVEQMNAA